MPDISKDKITVFICTWDQCSVCKSDETQNFIEGLKKCEELDCRSLVYSFDNGPNDNAELYELGVKAYPTFLIYFPFQFDCLRNVSVTYPNARKISEFKNYINTFPETTKFNEHGGKLSNSFAEMKKDHQLLILKDFETVTQHCKNF